MSLLADLTLVFVAGLITALATGLGALPFFFVDDVSDRWNVTLWGVAGGIMVSASLFGLVNEGLAYTDPGALPAMLVAGLLAGVVLVVAADQVLERLGYGHSHGGEGEHDHGGGDDHGDHGPDHGRDHSEGSHDHHDGHAHGDGHVDQAHGDSHDPDDTAADHVEPAANGGAASPAEELAAEDQIAVEEAEAIMERNWRKLLLILGILTVHSFPEGVAIGVSFAELGFEGGVHVLGFVVPVLAIFMTVAISIHNVPEGLAISIPLQALGMGRWRMVGAAVFSSLPQPIGAVVAFVFVRWAREFMPFGFGFAAGAMIYLVATEFVPEALETGESLPHGGYPELVAGLLVGGVVMVPLALL